MGLKKFGFDVPNGTTQGWVCPLVLGNHFLQSLDFGCHNHNHVYHLASSFLGFTSTTKVTILFLNMGCVVALWA